MIFEWDEAKNQRNIKLRGIDFADAAQVFFDDHALTFEDTTQSYSDGQRMKIIGRSVSLNNVVFVVYVEIDHEIIRIISARLAEKSEIQLFLKDINYGTFYNRRD